MCLDRRGAEPIGALAAGELRRRRPRARLTKAGRRAFAAHVAALQRIVAGAAAIAPGHQAAGEPVGATGDD